MAIIRSRSVSRESSNHPSSGIDASPKNSPAAVSKRGGRRASTKDEEDEFDLAASAAAAAATDAGGGGTSDGSIRVTLEEDGDEEDEEGEKSTPPPSPMRITRRPSLTFDQSGWEMNDAGELIRSPKPKDRRPSLRLTTPEATVSSTVCVCVCVCRRVYVASTVFRFLW